MMYYVHLFLGTLGLMYLARLSDEYLGKDVTRIVLIVLLGISITIQLALGSFIKAGLGFVLLCLYVFFVSESDPNDQNEAEDAELLEEEEDRS